MSNGFLSEFEDGILSDSVSAAVHSRTIAAGGNSRKMFENISQAITIPDQTWKR